MSYDQNEASTVRRLEQRIAQLDNRLRTCEIELAHREDRIAQFERQLEVAGDFHLSDLDEQTARLRAKVADLENLISDMNRIAAENQRELTAKFEKEIETLDGENAALKMNLLFATDDLNQARAVAREMAEHDDDGEGFCHFCGVIDYKDHAPDCPVTTVRRWEK